MISRHLPHAVTLSVAPTITPVTLTEAKKQCNVVATDDDTLLTMLIETATELVEKDSNRALITQTLVYTRQCFPAERYIELPRSPLQSVTSLAYIDTGGDSQTWAATNYRVDTKREPGVLWLDEDSDWPTLVADRHDAVTITYVVGHGDAVADVPQRARLAVMLLVAHWYRVREAVGQVGNPVAFAYRALIDALKPGGYL